MNIGIVTTWYERGAAYVSRAYMDALANEHEVFIYARGGEKYAKEDPRWDLSNVTWETPIPCMPSVTFINWHDFKKWLKNNAIEVLIFNEQRSWDILLKLQQSDILLGAYVDYYTPETVPFFKLYDFLLCNTKRHYSVFKDLKQTFYIPWGTDTNLCLPQKRSGSSEEVTFFHSAGMGGVNLRKGTDILVKSFQHVIGNAKLIIHSQVGLKKYSDVADLIENDFRINFIEKTVSLPGLYHMGDVYVYPTRLEGIGLSIPEALACGLPVITTDNPPMNEFVFHNQTGYLVKVSEFRKRADNYYWPESICDQNDLTKAMQSYVDNPGLAVEQGINARQYAKSHLNWQKNAERLGALLNTLAKSREITKGERRTVKTYENKQMGGAMIKGANHALSINEKSQGFRLFLMALKRQPERMLKRQTWSLIREFIGI